jgi:hypothetical protein
MHVSMYHQGIWVWTDGSAWDYTNWGIPEEPNGLHAENCLELMWYDYLNDLNCTITLTYVCKI